MHRAKENPAVGVSAGQSNFREGSLNNLTGNSIARSGENVKADTDAAVAFLERFSPEYSVALTAISTEGQIDGETFRADRIRTDAKDFIQQWNGKRNLYFSVNPVRKEVSPKASKKDIHSLAWLHVDCDPEPDKDLEAERGRILKMLQEYHRPPTIIIFSGGGYQAFWKLKKPVMIKNGKKRDDHIAELERYNKQLEIDLGGDNTHNLDRIMRLPFSWNLPNAAKLKKGRKKTMAYLVEFNDLEYDLADFTKVPADGSSKKTDVEIDTSKLPNVDRDGLPLDDKWKALIKDGENGEYGGDRSRAVFGVLGAMIRAGCSDAVMFVVITKKAWKISAHIYDQPNPEAYAERQISQAHEQVQAERQALTDEIESLTKDSDDIEGVLGKIRQEQFSAVREEQLLKKVKEKTGIGLAVLRKQLVPPKESVADMGMKIAKLTLDESFGKGNHLIRTLDGSFWQYTGKFWKRITDDMVSNRIISIIEQQAPDESYSQIAKQAKELLKGLQAKDDDPLRLTQEPLPIINVQGGELWLQDDGSVKLKKHRYDSYLPYCLNVEYDPKATCSEYDEALLGIFREVNSQYSTAQEMADYWNEWLGYTIQPRRDVPAYLMLVGGGANGKTSLTRVMSHLMGNNSVHAGRVDELGSGDKFLIGSLAGKLLFLDDDVTSNTRLPDGILKKISERKLLTGQLKFKDNFEFLCCSLPILLCNHYPNIGDLSHGMLRRAYIIPFDRRFTKEDADPKLFDRIVDKELSGVLNRALEGLRRLRERGGFEPPQACRMEYKRWLAAANPLTTFIEEECDRGNFDEEKGAYDGVGKDGKRLQQTLAAFYADFKKWAEDSGISRYPQRNTIKKHLESLGYDVIKDSGGFNAVVGLSSGDEIPL